MEDMHMDMSGSAATLGAALAVGRLKLKRNVVFVLAVAENAIDALAYKPHNILRSHAGLTVEVSNTDAEGRLVLADALSYVQTRYPGIHTIIDCATLTGACVIALGEYAAGLFTNNKVLSSALVSAGNSVSERLWPMPILPEHVEEITNGTPFADLKSTGAGRYGGSCTAAAFLQQFIAPGGEGENQRKVAWAHIDLAGPAMYSATRGWMNRGGTGFAVHTLAKYVASAPHGALPSDE
jgi:leucyl aminopeptidase